MSKRLRNVIAAVAVTIVLLLAAAAVGGGVRAVAAPAPRPLQRVMPTACNPVSVNWDGGLGSFHQRTGQFVTIIVYPHASCAEDNSYENFGFMEYAGEDANIPFGNPQFWDDRYDPYKSELGCGPGVNQWHDGFSCNQYAGWDINFQPMISVGYTVKATNVCPKNLTQWVKLFWNAGTAAAPSWTLITTSTRNYVHDC